MRVFSHVVDSLISYTANLKNIIWVADHPSTRSRMKLEHEELRSADFSIVIQDRLCSVKYRSGVAIYINISDVHDVNNSASYEKIQHPSHVYNRIECVDVNRCILYIYFHYNRFIMIDLITRTLIPTVLELPIGINMSLKSLTIDPKGNFWALCEIDNFTYRLHVYNQNAKLIGEYELIGSRVSRNSRGKLTQTDPAIERIIHHPTQNKLFIMYDENYIALLSTDRWTPDMYVNLPYTMRLAILCFMMIVWFPPFEIPRELIFMIVADLLDTIRTVDFTGNDKRKWITDARARIETHR